MNRQRAVSGGRFLATMCGLLFMTFCEAGVDAQAAPWVQKNDGLYGADIWSLAVNSSGHIFAGTYHMGVFRSSDNGDNWVRADSGTPGLSTANVRSLAVNSSGNVFAGTWYLGVFRSMDDGNSWTQISSGLNLNTYPDLAVNALVINSSGVIFAGTGPGGMYRSFNNGDSWTQINSGLTNTTVFSLAVNSSGHVFAGTNDGLFRSVDNGENWVRVDSKDSGFTTSTRIQSLSINSADGYIYAGTWDGVYRSADNGDSWAHAGSGSAGLPVNIRVMSLAVGPGGAIFAGTVSGGGIYRSVDNGDNWTVFNSGLTNVVVKSFAINANGDIFAGTEGVVCRLLNSAGAWTQINAGLVNTTIMSVAVDAGGGVFAGTYGSGVFRTTNDGDSWVEVNNGLKWNNESNRIESYIFSLAAGSNGKIFAGTYGGVYRSDDNGGLWNPVNTGLTDTYVRALVINANGDIFAGTVGSGAGGVFLSADDGAHWTQVNAGLTNLVVQSLAIDAESRVFAGTIGGGVFLSTDNGAHWTQVNAGLTNLEVQALAVSSKGSVFAGTKGGGVFRSSDHGALWTPVNTGLKNPNVQSLAVTVGGGIFAGTYGWDSGVYRSDNNGGGWTKINSGLTYTGVKSLAVKPSGYIFAGTECGGVYRGLYEPSPPVLASPLNNTAGISVNPVLNWNATAEAASYRLQVSTNPSFVTTIVDISSISAPSQKIGPLENGASYYWRVSVSNNGGTSAWSDAWKFTSYPARTSLLPGKLAIYFGYPSLVNGSGGNLDAAANEFGKYDIVVLGNSLQFPQFTGAQGQVPDYGCDQNSHYDHNNTVGIISRLNVCGTAVYGYVSIGGENTAWMCGGEASPLTMEEIKSHVDAWAAMGVAGIFFDEAEYGFGCSRERQNEAVDYVHGKGLTVFINGWNPDDIFKAEVVGSVKYTTLSHAGTWSSIAMNPTGATAHLGPDDIYLMESYQIINGSPQNPADWVSRSEKGLTYKNQYGTRIAAVTTPVPKKTYDAADQANFEYAWWSTLLYGFDFMGWGEANDYSSWGPYSNMLLEWPRPDPAGIGDAFTSAAVTHNPPWHTRKTTMGSIKVNTDAHTGTFTGYADLLTSVEFMNQFKAGVAGENTGWFVPFVTPNAFKPHFEAMLEALLNGNLEAADNELSALDLLGARYKLVKITDAATGGPVYGFMERIPPGQADYRGWGAALVRPGAAGREVYQAPHVVSDLYTQDIAMDGFLNNADSPALMFAGAHRYANPDNDSDGSNDSDVAHDPQSLFQALTEYLADRGRKTGVPCWFIQVHGAAYQAGEPTIVASDGAVRPPFPALTANSSLVKIDDAVDEAGFVSMGVCGWDEGTAEEDGVYQLGATQNVQGDFLETLGLRETFMHFEIEFLARNDYHNGVGQGYEGIKGLLAVIAAGAYNAVVKPVDETTGTTPVTVTFDVVSTPGATTLTTSAAGPEPPSGFALGVPPVYYDISTTAGFSPPITVCIDYTGVAVGNESNLKLYHYENNQWVDKTILLDTVNDLIYASVNSLSPFAVFAPCDLTLGTVAAPEEPRLVNTEISVCAPVAHSCPVEPVITWDWGDGAVSNEAVIDGVVSGTHSYVQPGVYTLILKAVHGGKSVTSMYQYVVVYNPNAGFVTGGGWIQSPEGAYSGDPSLAGKANFGFVSKYHKGASVPEGNTKFQFKAGDLNFSSSSYDWLVISGAKAQYKGAGTINGIGGYKFHLTIIDADENSNDSFSVDRFRIRIWNESAGVVYDNAKGSDEDGAITEIGGGSIMIHTEGAAKPAAEIVPTEFALFQNSPNPFNPATSIRYEIPGSQEVMVRLKIYDSRGGLVRVLVDGLRKPGVYRAVWNAGDDAGRRISSGLYIYRLEAGGFIQTRKMLFLR